MFGFVCLLVFPFGTSPQCGPPSRITGEVFVLIFCNLGIMFLVFFNTSFADDSTMLAVSMGLWLPVLIITSSTGVVFWPPYTHMQNGYYKVATFSDTLPSGADPADGLPFPEVKDKDPVAIRLNGQFSVNTSIVGYSQITIQAPKKRNASLLYGCITNLRIRTNHWGPEYDGILDM